METQVLEVDPLSDNKALYVAAAAALKEGKLVALPTETVYGLGADAFLPDAVARVFDAKGRPSFDPLIVHLASAKDLSTVADVPEELEETVATLARLFWPGPLTMILPKKPIVPDIVTSGLPTVAVRVSSHPVMRSVIRHLGHPIAAPSANRFGKISPTSASAVMKELKGRIDMVLDAGACSEGLESTIIRPMLDEKGKPGVEILREGPVMKEQFRNIVKLIRRKKPAASVEDEPSKPEAPGQLSSHYAPGKPMILIDPEEEFTPKEGVRYGLLSYEGESPLVESMDWVKVEVLSPGKGRMAEAAVRLFAIMRQMDEDDSFDVIVAETVPGKGLGAAMMDRLTRAAAQR